MGLELIVVLFLPRRCCFACPGFAGGSVSLPVVRTTKRGVLPVMVIGLEVFVEAGSSTLARSRACEKRLTDSTGQDPTVMQVVEDHVTAVCLCLQDHMSVVCRGVVVALEVHPIGQAIGASTQHLLCESIVVRHTCGTARDLPRIGFPMPLGTICIVLHPVRMAVVEGQFDPP